MAGDLSCCRGEVAEKTEALLPGLLEDETTQTQHLSAKKGSRASWGWISVLAGRDVPCQVVRKQLGDGVSTNIFKDPWVPSLP